MNNFEFRFWDHRFKRFEDAGYMFGPDGPQFPTDKIVPQLGAGLKDPTGKKIFAGDFLQSPDGRTYELVFGPYDGGGYCGVGFYLIQLPGRQLLFPFANDSPVQSNMTVIGNIYESQPE